MSAQLEQLPVFRAMGESDLDAVVAIETDIYAFPWTRGNFIDSMGAGYRCRVLASAAHTIGYGVLMVAAGESHLLNLSVAGALQRRGFGRMLLREFIDLARAERAEQMLLEVRPSNVAARALYAAQGFGEIGVRRGYYPDAGAREDAVVLRLKL